MAAGVPRLILTETETYPESGYQLVISEERARCEQPSIPLAATMDRCCKNACNLLSQPEEQYEACPGGESYSHVFEFGGFGGFTRNVCDAFNLLDLPESLVTSASHQAFE
jgi:hypothetical protein